MILRKKIMNPARAIAVLAMISVGCGTSSSSDEDSIVINNDQAFLAKRLELRDQPVNVMAPGSLKGNEWTYELRLVGELSPPVSGDQVLQATDVYVHGSRAFVSYNVQGAVQSGAIDSIEVNKPETPTLASQIIFKNTDINAIEYSGGKIFFTGAIDEASAPEAGKHTALGSLKVNGSKFTSELATNYLAGYAGTDIHVYGQTGYLTWGDNGGVTAFTPANLEFGWQHEIADARAVDVGANKMVTVLTGSNAKINSFDSDGSADSVHTIGGAETPQSKSVIIAGKRVSVASTGEDGWKLVCNADGTILKHVPLVDHPSIPKNLRVTNGVAVRHDLIFAANGEAGLYVYSVSANPDSAGCDNFNVELIGKADLGEGISANHVYAHSDHLFVASGGGGLKILTLKKVKDKSDIDDFDEQDDDDD